MIIKLKHETPQNEVEQVKKQVVGLGCEPRVLCVNRRTLIVTGGNGISAAALSNLRCMEAVEDVLPTEKRYQLADRRFHPSDSVVNIGNYPIGGWHFRVIAGPCAVESREQIRQVTRDLVAAGVHVIRGGAYKPRTSPYDFQGLGEKGLDLLAEVKQEFGVAVVTEVVGTSHIKRVSEVADMLQIGSRNCQNYHLLEAAAGAGRPVLLKRGMATTVEEWISAAEYLMVNGCADVVLCERGIRSFETSTRNTLDLGGVALAKQETHLPVIVDPSHAAGLRSLVLPLAKAGIAVGADGLLIEAHPDPDQALSDGKQQLPSGNFKQVMAELNPYVKAAGKQLG